MNDESYYIIRVKTKHLHTIINKTREYVKLGHVRAFVYGASQPGHLFLQLFTPLREYLHYVGPRYVFTYGRHTFATTPQIKRLYELTTAEHTKTVTYQVGHRVSVTTGKEKTYGKVIGVDTEYLTIALQSTARFPIICKVHVKGGNIERIDDRS